MISEERLRAAAKEAGAALDHASLPEEAHEFSQKYRNAVRQMESRSRHPAWTAGLRRVAVVLLVLLGLGGGWLTVDAQAREIVFGWISEKVSGAYHYSFFGSQRSSTNVRFILTEIPDGYTLFDQLEGDGYRTELYVDDDGQILSFEYTSDPDSLVGVISGDIEKETILINGIPADYYQSEQASTSNTLVWKDVDSGTLLALSGFFDKDDLIQYAENVKPQK